MLIPRHDVTPAVDIDYAALRVPTAYEVINGFTGNREYEPLIDVGVGASSRVRGG
jgi:hypothetical protein